MDTILVLCMNTSGFYWLLVGLLEALGYITPNTFIPFINRWKSKGNTDVHIICLVWSLIDVLPVGSWWAWHESNTHRLMFAHAVVQTNYHVNLAIITQERSLKNCCKVVIHDDHQLMSCMFCLNQANKTSNTVQHFFPLETNWKLSYCQQSPKHSLFTRQIAMYLFAYLVKHYYSDCIIQKAVYRMLFYYNNMLSLFVFQKLILYYTISNGP